MIELADGPRPSRQLVELASRLYPYAAGRLPWDSALRALLDLGFARPDNDAICVARHLRRGHTVIDLLTAMLHARPPAWLLLGEIVDDEIRLRQPYGPIPEDDVAALQDWGLLELDGVRVPSSAMSFWRQLLAAIQAPGLTDRAPDNDGVDGEEAVVAAEMARLNAIGRQDLADRVIRVSLISDGFGYDVRSYFGTDSDAGNSDNELHIEVKSTTVAVRRSQDFRMFLTRHEYEVSQRDNYWGACMLDSRVRMAALPRTHDSRRVRSDRR